ncbi:MAG: N-acetylmuramoyl-L-alanine amidase [Rhodocyclaceae bacterium]|nr:N-acetylmuramoyl-L-alanine amidase [Rhodocyclaceae bacterium]MBX3669706.1 N-acetylmuramoyl-L-alanine amidase [Rhodocyclaceae bacterium]
MSDENVSASGLSQPSRRRLLQYAGAALLLSVRPVAALAAGVRVLAVRVWPASDYTRVTLECARTLVATHFAVKDPDRLVVDLEGVEFDSVLASLPGKILESDPYIKLIRAGRNRPGVVRLVIELKQEVAPQVFTLQPVGEYGHRLVLDLYPTEPVDPLLALMEQREKAAEAAIATDAPVQEARADTPPEVAQDAPAEARTERRADTRAVRGRSRGSQADVARLATIVLDPGHGGEDPGALGKGGSQEKDVTLAVAKRLKTRIEADPNMRVLLTRDSDFFVPLQHRVAKARRVQADLFVSIHADAFVKPHARGSSVFVLSERGASSAAARWLAARENSADVIGGINVDTRDPYLARTLLDLSQTATSTDSLKLAKAVLGEIGTINTLHRGQVEEAGFAVLKAPDIPSILVETAFISNPEEERRLNDEAYQGKLADAILRGIRRYLAKVPPSPKSRIALL